MTTRRVDVNITGPTLELLTDADIISQSQSGNYSTVNYFVGCINRGGTTTFSNNAGSQTATIGGSGGAGHSGTIPSGVANGATRWYDGPFAVNMNHDAAGNRGTDSVIQYINGWKSVGYSQSDGGSIGPYPRIPKPATPPGTPVASNILPTSVKLDWTASTDDGGSSIDGYLVRQWLGALTTGAYTDVSQTNTLTRTPTGLTPGTQYTYAVYAHNGSNGAYSLVSDPVTITTLAPMHFKVAGVWKYGIPYLKVAGIWKLVLPWVRVSGVWKQTK